MKLKYARTFACISAIALGATGCYHATIDTGLAPSTTVIDKPWANGFVYGLVPPSTVETAAKCPHGAAKVETQQSFLNGVVNVLTFGIYTPMQITVTCASTGTMADGAPVVSGSDLEVVLAQAIQKSSSTGTAVIAQVTK